MSDLLKWLWLDDCRPVPDDRWTAVRTAEECIELIKAGGIEKLSLDHDLGIGYSNGYKVACFVEEAAHHGTIEPIMRMYAHSANPVGRRKMGQALHNAYKIWREREALALHSCKDCGRTGPVSKRISPHMGVCGTCGRDPTDKFPRMREREKNS